MLLWFKALRQKLPYKEFSFVDNTLDNVIYTSVDCDYGCWVVCDLKYTYKCTDNTRYLQLLPLKRKNDLG